MDSDEKAIASLVELLARREDIDVTDGAATEKEAVEYLRLTKYDVVIVDLNAPFSTVAEVTCRIRELNRHSPFLIVLASSSEQAVDAFKYRVGDYLLKPICEQHLNRALDDAKRVTMQQRGSLSRNGILDHNSGIQSASKIAFKAKGRIIFRSPHEIISIKAEGNSVFLQQHTTTHLLSEQISALEKKLTPLGFLRIHRSVLINCYYIEWMEPLRTGEYLLGMTDGTQFNVTRTYKKHLKYLGNGLVTPPAERNKGR